MCMECKKSVENPVQRMKMDVFVLDENISSLVKISVSFIILWTRKTVGLKSKIFIFFVSIVSLLHYQTSDTILEVEFSVFYLQDDPEHHSKIILSYTAYLFDFISV